MGEAKEVHDGGCLCGEVRYRAEGPSTRTVHCHCSLCRRSSGAAFVTWVGFPSAAFRFVQGVPVNYHATDKAERAFCGRCGTQLTFRHVDSAHMVDVTVGSLDDPNAVRPNDHIWESSRLPWLHIDDGLPRWPGERE